MFHPFTHWNDRGSLLKDLAVYERVFPFLPVGWGHEGKGPCLKDWTSHPGFSIVDAVAADGAIAVGVRTGFPGSEKPGLLCFDIDGASALDRFEQSFGSIQNFRTWQVHRTTDPKRLKVLVVIISDDDHYQELLQVYGTDFIRKISTAPPQKDANGVVIAKAEALEVFFSQGRQVIVAGSHKASGGSYFSPEGYGPRRLAALGTEYHIAALTKLLREAPATPAGVTSAKPSPKAARGRGHRLNPCPICGRNDNLWCEEARVPLTGNTGVRDLIFCMPGNTFNATLAHGALKVGDTVHGLDGITYALVKETLILEGTVTTWAAHDEKRSRLNQKPQQTLKPSTPSMPSPDIRDQLHRSYQAPAGTPAATDEQTGDPREDDALDSINVGRGLDNIRGLFALQRLVGPTLAAHLDTVTAEMNLDAVTTTVLFLTGLSSALKLGHRAATGGTYSQPLGLFSALVRPSGTRKTSVLKALVFDPLQPVGEQMDKINRQAEETWKTENEGRKPADRTLKPRPLSKAYGDWTPEGMALMATKHELSRLGLLMARDEGSGLFASIGKYQRDRADAEGQLLELWDGRSETSVIRKVADCDQSSWRQCHAALVTNLQPGILRQLVADGDDRGLWARILMLIPDPYPGDVLDREYTPEEQMAHAAAMEGLQDVIQRAFVLPTRTYKLSSEAHRRWAQHATKQGRICAKARNSAEGAIHGKASAQALRLAGLLHVVRHLGGKLDVPMEIDAVTMDQGLSMIDLLMAYVVEFKDTDERTSNAISDMKRIQDISWNDGQPKPVTLKDVKDTLTRARRKEFTKDVFRHLVGKLVDGRFGEPVIGARGGVSYVASKPWG